MTRKHLAILATAGLVWSLSAAHAVDAASRLTASTATKADAANGALNPQAVPTDLSAAKKKKGKGGTKSGEQYMTIRMQDLTVSSYRSPQGGRPKRPPSGDLLGTTGGNFNPNAPSPTGTPMGPPAGRGGPGPVIR